jgi:hypothetical protein
MHIESFLYRQHVTGMRASLALLIAGVSACSVDDDASTADAGLAGRTPARY